MKKESKLLLIWHLIFFGLIMGLTTLYEISAVKEGIVTYILFPAFIYIPLLILCGIPTIIRKIIKKRTAFRASTLFGAILGFDGMLLMYTLFEADFIDLNSSTIAWIILIKAIISAILIVIEATLYHKVGFFYIKLFRLLLEKLFKLKVISDDDYEAGREQIESRRQARAEELKQAGDEEQKPSFVGKIFGSVGGFLGKNRKPVLIGSLSLVAAVILVTAGIFGYGKYRQWYNENKRANIISTSPGGYTGERVAIEVIYDSDIEFVDPAKPGDVLKIEPALKGRYEINGRTLRFIPDGPLSLSARYKAKVDGSKLKSPVKQSVESREFSFNTKMTVLDDFSFYYIMDEVTKKPVELVGELRFSLPVEQESLKSRVRVTVDGEELPFRMESSSQNSIYYLKITGFDQSDEDQMIELNIDKGVVPINGVIPTEKDEKRSVALKAKEELKVVNLESHPVVGNTYLALRFNLPVVEKDIRKHITISPAIPFEVDAEYRYVILKANFKPNVNYTVKVSKSLSSRYDSYMKESYSRNIQIRDMDPYVRFSSSGRILPYTNNLNMEFVSLNLDLVDIKVEKVYKNNLIYYLTGQGDSDGYGYGYYDYDYGNSSRKYMRTRRFTIEGGNVNEEVKNLVNLKELMQSDYEGLYYLTLSDAYGHYSYNSQLINVTKMGLILKNDGTDLHAYAVDIMSQAPLSGVKLSLISRENQIIQVGTTDSSGRFIFKRYENTKEGLSPYLIFAERGNDFSYLKLDQSQLDYSSFDIAGTSFRRGIYEAFAATERGVYRPGEPVYTTVILRSEALTLPESVPLNVKVTDPAGKDIYKSTFKTGEEGLASLTIPTSSHYKTGSYALNIYRSEGDIIGSTSFKVEEFIPNTIEVSAEIVEQSAGGFSVKVKANELHGAPSRGLKVKGSVVYSSRRFSHKEYEDYSFYDNYKESFNRFSVNLNDAKLDDNGEYVYQIDMPKGIKPPSALRALIYVEVYDTAGRPVGDAIGADLDYYNSYMGVKVSGTRPFKSGKKLKVEYVAIDPKGKRVKEEYVTVKIRRKVWYSIFKKYRWKEGYSSEYYDELLYKKTITVDGLGSLDFTPDKGGQYIIEVAKEGGMSTSTSFYVDGYGYDGSRDMSDPYKLHMTLDKKGYTVGETAYLTIKAPFDGKALLSWERDRIYQTRMVDITGGRATLQVKVTDDFVPNMYITAVAYRKPTYEDLPLPPVSYGAVNIALDKSKQAARVDITTEQLVRSAEGIKVDLKVENGAGTKVVIAAVDEGILQITSYQRPEPYDFFYRKRRLSVRTGTNLKDLLPDIAPYKKAFGGGYDGDLERRHLNPIEAKRVKSLSLYSGILECDEQGRVSHSFELPQFNGKVRVMVMTVKDKQFGSTESKVTISDPIVLSPGIPRFMSPGDKALIPLKIFNKTEKDGQFKVYLETDGPLKIDGKSEGNFTIKKDGEAKTEFYLEGDNDAGVAHIRFRAEGNGESTYHETELAVRPASPLNTVTFQGEIKPGEEAIVKVPGGYIKEGSYRQLSLSSDRMVKFMGALEYLIRYPYGCTEQTTSAAFPLIYMKEFANRGSLFRKNPYMLDKYVGIAIKKLENRQFSSGRFAFWDGVDYSYTWVDDYASHFLLEARRLGYPVSDNVYDRILSRIGLIESKMGRLDRRRDNLGDMSPYLLYLASLAGHPDYDRMRSYYDQLADDEKSEQMGERTRCLLAAAYALAGDKDKARAFLPADFRVNAIIRTHKDNLDSYARNTALYLYAMGLIDSEDSIVTFLEEELMKKISKDGHFGNTQSTAWALMALNQVSRKKAEKLQVELYSGTTLVQKLGKEMDFYNEQLKAEEYRIVNTGTTPCYYSVVSFGVPLKPDTKAITQGLKVTKEYRDTEGRPIDIKSIKQSDQIVVTLTVEKQVKEELENVVLVDLLPAGFEIVNWRLASRGDYSNVPKENMDIAYTDIRDDRILIFTKELYSNNSFSYVVKAVSPGEFNNPQFLAEAMYDPAIQGRTKGGESIIIKEEE